MRIDRHGLNFGRGDVFDYTTLGDVMIRWLKEFKKHGKNGCPGVYLPESEEDHYTDEQIDAGIEQMYKEIDDLIWALDDNNSPDILDDMIDLDFDVWREELMKYEKERTEKLQLFAKLYTLLWR